MHYKKIIFQHWLKRCFKDRGAARRVCPLVAKSVSTAPEWRRSKLYIHQQGSKAAHLKKENSAVWSWVNHITKRKRKKTCFLVFFSHFVLFGFYTFSSAGTSWLQSSPLRLRKTPGAVLTYSPPMRSSCGFTTSSVQYIQESCACLNSSGFFFPLKKQKWLQFSVLLKVVDIYRM